jgi:hypothetical protein
MIRFPLTYAHRTLITIAACLLIAPAAHAADRFGKPTTVGLLSDKLGGLSLRMAGDGHTVLAVASAPYSSHGQLALATRGPGKPFAPFRTTHMAGWPMSPVIQLGMARATLPVSLGIDSRGRPIALEGYKDGCCVRIRARFFNAKGRPRKQQVLTPQSKRDWNAGVASDLFGDSVVESFPDPLDNGPQDHVATSVDGAPFEKARTLPQPGPSGHNVAPAPGGALLATYWDSYGVLIARRSPSGHWSHAKSLFRSADPSVDGPVSPGVLQPTVGRAALLLGVGFNAYAPEHLLISWSADGVHFAKVVDATNIPSAAPAMAALDATGRLTVVWEDDYNEQTHGYESLRAASARFGKKFSKPRTVTRLPTGYTVVGPDIVAGGSRTVVAWLSYDNRTTTGPDTLSAVELDSGRPAGKPQKIATGDRSFFGGALGLDSHGGGILAWEQHVRAADGKLRTRVRASTLPRR